MATLLDRSSFPLWVWIIVIVVGSLVVLCTAVTLFRCWSVRRHPDVEESVAEEPSSLLIRRVTVRRGRLVPTSNYLSLTGSRFGINQFGESEKQHSRQSSPFNWLNSIVDVRAFLRDDSTYAEHHNTARSQSMNSINYRHKYSSSQQSLSSEKSKDTIVTISEIADDLVVPAITTDGSTCMPSSGRSHAHRSSPSPLTQKSPLPPIEESSPHASMISTRSAPKHFSGRPISAIAETRDPMSNLRRQSRPWSTVSSTMSIVAPYRPRPESTTALPQIPDSVHVRISRSDLAALARNGTKQEYCVCPEEHYQHDNFETPTDSNPIEASQYIVRRPSKLTLVRSVSTSNKGNVLRKKSLMRAQLVTMATA